MEIKQIDENQEPYNIVKAVAYMWVSGWKIEIPASMDGSTLRPSVPMVTPKFSIFFYTYMYRGINIFLVSIE
jgi:hypothetical protein